MPDDYDALISSSPLAWVALNNFVQENQQPVEYKDHRFLIQPMNDMSPDLVVKKSAQVGFSVLAIFKSIWLCKYMGMNVIYVLPTQNLSKDFVTPKVNPLIMSNPKIMELITQDRESLKRIGDRNLFFRGAASEREAISITGDVLVLDEYDRMTDMTIVNMYDSRLQASKFSWRWRFSNPSQLGFGVDGLYQDSDQMHWFIKCDCGHEWYIDFEANDQNHYIDQELRLYVCGKCNQQITDKQRRNGRWVAKYPNRKRRGYWISQLMAPWVSADRILEQKDDSSEDFFHNFVLGKAYTPSDLVVNRETILRACSPGTIPKVGVAMGVDQNVSEQIWVAGTSQGIFAHGKTKSWEELERLKLTWNAVVVSDPAPYPTHPKILAEKYNDFYLCYFKEMKDLSVLEWKNSIVYADRTRLLDIVANEITEAKLLFRESPYQLEDYIADWNNLYRTTVEENDGRTKSKWLKKDGKESDFSLATAYFRTALSRTLQTGNSSFIEPNAIHPVKEAYIAKPSGEVEVSLGDIVRDTFENLEP